MNSLESRLQICERQQEDIPADLINIAIARHDLYVDLGRYRLSEPHIPLSFARRT